MIRVLILEPWDLNSPAGALKKTKFRISDFKSHVNERIAYANIVIYFDKRNNKTVILKDTAGKLGDFKLNNSDTLLDKINRAIFQL